ncbi:MAG TPA: copper chaperone PCu(A)C [Pseudolabrys sp.]|nr:copper chaperone PCu(A)C [Pseudolabrys sp.]
MNKIGFFVAALVCATCMAGTAHAGEVMVGGLKLTAAWARATPKGATVGGGYVTITNTGNTADRLVGGTSDVSKRFEIHEMSMNNGVMKMREVTSGVEIGPGRTIRFEPSGYHIMFVGLKQPLKEGDHIKATLQFEKAGNASVDFVVESIGARSGGSASQGGRPMQHGH